MEQNKETIETEKKFIEKFDRRFSDIAEMADRGDDRGYGVGLANLQTDIMKYHVAELDTERERIVDEVIALSDLIETQDNTKFDEWRAFKGFRNALRDKYTPSHTGEN